MKKFFILLPMLILPFTILFGQSIQQMPAAATPGVLTFTATESTAGGNYAPKHLTAVWIQDNANKFVKTLLIHAVSFKMNLTYWEKVTSDALVRVDQTDAITGATEKVYSSHTCTWNGTDIKTPRTLLPDGTYTVHMQMVDKNKVNNVMENGHYAFFTFVKGPNAVDLKPANQNGFSNISLKWVPTVSAINEVELAKMYTIFPNPVNTSFTVKGNDILSLELFTITGEKVKTTNESQMNISSLAKGNYIVVVNTANGTFSKKIVKL